jgi:HD-like signal output (HDOD) protein
MTLFEQGASQELDGAEVKRLLRQLLSSPGYRPPVLPQVAVELVQLSQRPSVQFEEVVKLLAQDPVLAARTLSIAQSAAYAARSPILSLHQATVRLGLKGMRDLVLEAALHLKVFRAPGYEQAMERLARHSAATAHVVRAVCRRTRVDAEYAFLCGLLHDVGFAVGLLALAAEGRWRGAGFEALAPVLDEVHEEAAGIVTRLWKLPEAIQGVVARHHQVVVDGRAQPVHAALVVAEQLCWEAGCGMLPPPEDADPMAMTMAEPPLEGLDANWTGLVEEARKALGLDELALCAARAEAFELLAKVGLLASRE